MFFVADRISFLFKPELYYVVYIYLIFFIHLSVDIFRLFPFFEILFWIQNFVIFIMNSAEVNTGVNAPSYVMVGWILNEKMRLLRVK